MEKLKKIANTLDSVAKFIFYINIGAAILFLVIVIIIFGEVLKDQNILREYLILTLGSVKLGIVPEYAPSVTYTNIQFFSGTFMVFLVTFFVLCGVKIAREILKPMKEGLPFDESISKNLKNLGILTLIGGGEMGKIIIRLDRVMADRKMSLNELSERVGVSNVNLSKIKTGKVSAIRFSTLEAICEVLECQPGDILEYQKNEE